VSSGQTPSWDRSTHQHRGIRQSAEPYDPAVGGPDDGLEIQVPAELPNEQQGVVLAVSKNNQGVGGGHGYALVALIGTPYRGHSLVQLIPEGAAQYWSEDDLPPECRRVLGPVDEAGPMQLQQPFLPVVVRFEVLPPTELTDAMFDSRDVLVARTLAYVRRFGSIEELQEHLGMIAHTNLEQVWPESAWATPKALVALLDLPKLAVFWGKLEWVHCRAKASTQLDICIGDKKLQRIPYSPHQLQEDGGAEMLQWMHARGGTCLLLLGRSSTILRKTGPTTYPLLLHRLFCSNR